MKKTLSILLAFALTAALAVSASAVVMTWDEGDQTWWSPEFDYNIDPGTTDEYIVVLEDGTVSGNQGGPSWNPDSASTPDGLAEQAIEANLITNLNPGWYEAAFYDIGEDCTGAEGKIALISRGSSTFTVKNENAKAAGAFAAIILNNGNGETIDDVTYFMEGNNGAIGMYEDYEIMPNCSVSTDVSIRILSQMYGISLADAWDAVLNCQIEGVSGLDVGAKTTHIFLGTMKDYEEIGAYDASKLITADKALKADAVLPGNTEAPPPPEFAVAGLQMPTDMAVLKNDGKSYDDAASAAKAIGSNPITAYGFVSGSSGNAGESAKNLWDGDTATKFCTSSFEALSAVKLDAPLAINGIIMATANDNASYNGRNPNEWAIFGSNDGEVWNPIAYGDDTFFDETNFTYYAASIDPTEAYQYFQFQASGTDSGTFQVSEVVLCSADAAEVAAEEPAAASSAYPASGESGNFMMGKVIGNETGWDGTEASGAASAFDGNAATFFDPLGVGDGFCGMEYDEPYILEKVAILSRSGWLDRFEGATIEGSNDGEEWEELWCSEEAAPSETEYNIITEFENNYGYKMYRYVNYTKHGDVAEVEFYGKPGTAERPAKEEEPAPAAEEPKAEEPTAQEVVENAAEAVGDAVGEVAENVSEAAENAAEAVSEAASDAAKKAGCGSFIGGGLIVLVTVLGSAWIAKRH